MNVIYEEPQITVMPFANDLTVTTSTNVETGTTPAPIIPEEGGEVDELIY